jgi:DNA repair protein RadD
MVSQALHARGINNRTITATTIDGDRETAINAFKAGTLKCLVNTNILSIGFDAPHVDLIVMLRPTESPGLYYQQAGRGFRTCPGKDSCTILDMAGNMERHGPITTLNQRVSDKAERKGNEGGEAPAKTCEQCQEIVHCAVMTCPNCGHQFAPRPIAKHGTTAADGDPLHGATVWHEVGDCQYSVWPGKDGKPDTLRVDYYEPDMLHKRIASEWVCVQHPPGSYAHTKAMQWLMQRLDYPIANGVIIIGDEEISLTPDNLCAPDICRYIKVPKRIQTKPDGKYVKITDYDLTEVLDDHLPF